MGNQAVEAVPSCLPQGFGRRHGPWIRVRHRQCLRYHRVELLVAAARLHLLDYLRRLRNTNHRVGIPQLCLSIGQRSWGPLYARCILVFRFLRLRVIIRVAVLVWSGC